MTFALISLFVFLGIVWGLVVASVRFPNNKYILALSDWQTLVGSLIGLIVLSIAIASETRLERLNEAEVRNASELAYLQIFKQDYLDLLDRRDNFETLALSNDEYGENTFLRNADDCEAFRVQLLWPSTKAFVMEDNFSSYINDVSPEVFNVLYAALLQKQRYEDYLSHLSLNDCESGHEQFLRAAKSFHEGFEPIFRSQLNSIDAALLSRLSDS